MSDGTDLRGFQSVEGRLRDALGSLVGNGNFENIQVSSRTDRGVHALKNTLHVDIRQRPNKRAENKSWEPNNIVNGLNFHLIRQHTSNNNKSQSSRKRTRGQPQTHAFLGSPPRRHSPPHEVRVLGAAKAPLSMKNSFYTGNDDDDQHELIDWNARFSATQRAYVYRIFHQPIYQDYHGIPFEWDRSWLVRDAKPLDISAMRKAALYLTGTRDFTSFRGNNCQRASPIVTMKQIAVNSQSLDSLGMLQMGEMLGLDSTSTSESTLVMIGIVGESFLYRQVRNMVGCLVEVGRGKLESSDVLGILKERDRRIAPSMAPAHGLFLVDVQHGDFVF